MKKRGISGRREEEKNEDKLTMMMKKKRGITGRWEEEKDEKKKTKKRKSRNKKKMGRS